ncbi:MAG: hypothetical protein HDQ87_11365 [Clostridia bacterium]|nr:hypothetical protein [Clostridia bacterium]
MADREVDFPLIGDRYYGGSQDWYRTWMMRLGGCSTTTACELCLCLARSRSDMRLLYPGDLDRISREDFCRFADLMYPYVHPELNGLTDVDRYAMMLKSYAASVGARVETETLRGERPLAEAEKFIRTAVDSGRPVSFLLLRHRNPALDDFEWHWFTVTGYADTQDGLQLSAANYGRRCRLNLALAWDTGYAQKGGLAVLRAPQSAG